MNKILFLVTGNKAKM